jgi:hypothetical protein
MSPGTGILSDCGRATNVEFAKFAEKLGVLGAVSAISALAAVTAWCRRGDLNPTHLFPRTAARQRGIGSQLAIAL